MLPTPFILSSEQRQKRSLTQDVIPYLNTIIFQYTNPLSFETEAHMIHTIPLIREHCDSYLYHFRYKTLEKNTMIYSFSTYFNKIQGINTKITYRTIHPQNKTLSVQDVCATYMNKLIEDNERLDPPLYLSSHLKVSNKNTTTMKYQILKQIYNDMATPTIGYNKIYYKLNEFKTDPFGASYSLKKQYHKSKTFPTIQ